MLTFTPIIFLITFNLGTNVSVGTVPRHLKKLILEAIVNSTMRGLSKCLLHCRRNIAHSDNVRRPSRIDR